MSEQVWFTSPATTPRTKLPDENLVRFIKRTFGSDVARILDIGSGSGANSHWLEAEGFEVTSIDSAPEANGAQLHLCGDISKFNDILDSRYDCVMDINNFYDCIIDINTLCHVENPPYEEIYRILKPGGKFFSIHPADDTDVDMAGKGYTRLADVLTMRRLLGRGFTRFTVHKNVNWNGDQKISSWQIEADK